MKKYFLVIITFYLTLQIKAQTVSDVDGNTYNTVTIGTQTWMKENLKTTKYNDGTAISNITDNAVWIALTTPAYCWYNNEATTNKTTYGALYNWYTVNTNKLCPTGWHIPSDVEWTTLAEKLGGESEAGGKLKATGTTYWNDPNDGATNETNFSALPGGRRSDGGAFYHLGYESIWWCSSNNAKSYSLKFNSHDMEINGFNKSFGFSVRCLKDDNTSSINLLGKSLDNAIYPNPASDRLYIKNSKSSNAQIIIFDLRGKQVVNIQTGINPIDISGLHNGVYIVKIIDSGKTVISKLIKE